MEVNRNYSNQATPKPKADLETQKVAPNNTQNGFNTNTQEQMKVERFQRLR